MSSDAERTTTSTSGLPVPRAAITSSGMSSAPRNDTASGRSAASRGFQVRKATASRAATRYPQAAMAPQSLCTESELRRPKMTAYSVEPT